MPLIAKIVVAVIALEALAASVGLVAVVGHTHSFFDGVLFMNLLYLMGAATYGAYLALGQLVDHDPLERNRW